MEKNTFEKASDVNFDLEVFKRIKDELIENPDDFILGTFSKKRNNMVLPIKSKYNARFISVITDLINELEEEFKSI